MTPLQALNASGQSVWLNYLRRAFMESGELGNLLEEGIGGITSTPVLFAKAISHSRDYDAELLRLLREGMPAPEIHEALVVDDMQRAADCLHPVHEASDGLDGYVSVELNPALAHDAVGTGAAARRLLRAVDRVNAMIEIPATPEGIDALRDLTSDGISVNVTHVFSIAAYEQAAAAYMDGLDEFFTTHGAWRIAPSSVVSFSLSRIDRVVDAELVRLEQGLLLGQAAISLAKVVYGRYQTLFSGPHWEKLARHGARSLRLKWTRTTPRSFDYDPLHYVTALIGPDTVMTFSPVTLNQFRQQGIVAPTLLDERDKAHNYLQALAGLGIDLEAIAAQLQQESLTDFTRQFQALIRSVMIKQEQLQNEWLRLDMKLGAQETAVNQNLFTLCRTRAACRMWAHDQTLWQPIPDSDQLGWLHLVETMQENLGMLASFVRDVHEAGLHSVVVMGVGGAGLAAKTLGQLCHTTDGLPLHVLTTTHPHTIRRVSRQIDPTRTLFIVADKAGEIFDTQALFKHFYNLVGNVVGADRVGWQFVAITDSGSTLHTLANDLRFRRVFLNDPHMVEAYSPLSYFGLVPAALAGVNLSALLDHALAMVCNGSSCNCADTGDNVGLQLGAALVALANAGRDKLTLITSPALAAFAPWWEYLLAVSLGKQGQSLVPIVGEPLGAPAVYGDDRTFVYLHLEGDEPVPQVAALQAAGHPLLTLHWQDVDEVGGQFFVWQMATAVAAHLLHINPFTQPDVAQTQQRIHDLLTLYQRQGRLPPGKAAPINRQSLDIFLNSVQPGDYVAIQAFMPQTAEHDAILQSFRTCLRERYIATTVAYGPDYLHTTDQLYQGGRRNGHFLQLTQPLPLEDVHIPDEAGESAATLSFGVLTMAQALADGQALAQNWRHMMRFHLTQGAMEDLRPLLDA
ncbi:MAG: bifunctional transaldolase/phosoglucose isomerase [Ardenticatenaceae bacterium]|nr:bifunctional transaldolase/phosoglucose isomerase [Anaerolineales bacterium]MCB8920389.1 bifunctional transaldolase/phosoglucose isomerase [Ardenticatenaceae bacterium]MCB8989344.1 bifunctional transaldolase/phosoglucose isomerase [Ardenticatenaceae bacterium]